jgi:hypothetical protein
VVGLTSSLRQGWRVLALGEHRAPPGRIPETSSSRSPASALYTTRHICTVKKGLRHSRPRPGCHLPNSQWPVKIYLFPPRESLVSDIPVGDGNVANLFLRMCSNVRVSAAFYQLDESEHRGLQHLSHTIIKESLLFWHLFGEILHKSFKKVKT